MNKTIYLSFLFTILLSCENKNSNTNSENNSTKKTEKVDNEGFDGPATATIPPASPIKRQTGRSKINHFLKNHVPSSFLINIFDPNTAKGLGDYICKTDPNIDCYLHIYLAYNKLDGSDQFLIIAGTILTQNGDMKHDSSAPGIWRTSSIHTDNCCIISDKLNINNSVTSACDISTINTDFGLILISDPTQVTQTMQYLKNYQKLKNENQDGTLNPIATESILVSANDLRDYLLSGGYDASVPANNINNPVQYLHLYFGTSQLPNSPNLDSLAIIIVGAEKLNSADQTVKNGVHNFSISSSGVASRLYSYVFDEGFPCPKCNVDRDKIDYHNQFDGSHQKDSIGKYIPFQQNIKQSKIGNLIEEK
jgi:hypothetical protein